MDFGRAISYIRQDPSWLIKVLLGSIITIVPLLNFAALGYSLDVTRNVYEAHLVAQAHRQSAGGMVTEPARL